MATQERLDYWRNERRLVETRLASPQMTPAFIAAFRGDIRMTERFIRYYEARLVREGA